jgi:hypothetical protein
MRTLKKFGVLAVAIFALSAIGVASASAAQFTASATGTAAAKQLENQVFTTNGGEVVCTGLTGTGPIKNTTDVEIHMTINYTGCKAFSIATVHISAATYTFTADGTVHVVNPITITPTIFGVSACTTTVPAQTLTGIGYSNPSSSTVKVTPTVNGITYTTTGGVCGASGSNGTYRGAAEASRVGGGTIQFDS